MGKASLPEPEFKEEMGGFSVYLRKDLYTQEYLRNLGLNERQIKAVVYVKGKGKITNKEYQKLNGVSKATATRDLLELVNRGLFKIIGESKRILHYTLLRQK